MSESGRIVAVDDVSFRAEVLEEKLPVLVKFSTPWCGPCQALTPVAEAVARDFEGRLKVVALDAEDAPGIAASYGIRAYPTVVLLKDGRELTRRVGAMSRARLVELVAEHL